MSIKIALAGNPNSGKTTLFNGCLLYTSDAADDLILGVRGGRGSL